MRYWEEMLSKSGFSDGAAIPVGIEAYREAYLSVVNALAAQFGSKFWAVPYDRTGMHNSYLILFVPVSTPDMWPKADCEVGGSGINLVDEPMRQAIDAACNDCPVDACVTTEVVVKRGALKLLLYRIEQEEAFGSKVDHDQS